MAEAIINRECSSEEDSVMSVSEHEKDLEKSSKKSGKRKRKSRYDILDEKYDSLNGKLDFLTDFIGKLESRENTEVVNQQKSPTNIRNTGVFDPQKSVEKENTDLQKSPTFNFQDPEENDDIVSLAPGQQERSDFNEQFCESVEKTLSCENKNILLDMFGEDAQPKKNDN